MRLMIVDDNGEMRSLVRMFAIHPGDAVQECASGEQAVALLGGFRPDVVLMDLQMPGVDGIATTRVIKEFDSGIRVIVVTNFADDQSRKAAMQAGADAFVSKEDLAKLPALLHRPDPTGPSP